MTHLAQAGHNAQMHQALTAVRSGIFVSDLHLFSPRSIGQKMVRDLSRLSVGYDCIVLGGDIFDFRWSLQGSHAATLQATRQWLLNLLRATRDVPIFFLPGNHDCHPDFLETLELLAKSEPRFFWAAHHLQISDCLFLHGDVLDAGGIDGLAGYRRKFHHELPRSALAHRSYDMVVGMRIHKLVPLLRHQPPRTCQRLLEAIGDLSLHADQPVRRVFFGHTHVPIHGLQVENVQFFNPGASLKYMEPHIHIFEIEPA